MRFALRGCRFLWARERRSVLAFTPAMPAEAQCGGKPLRGVRRYGLWPGARSCMIGGRAGRRVRDPMPGPRVGHRVTTPGAAEDFTNWCPATIKVFWCASVDGGGGSCYWELPRLKRGCGGPSGGSCWTVAFRGGRCIMGWPGAPSQPPSSSNSRLPPNLGRPLHTFSHVSLTCQHAYRSVGGPIRPPVGILPHGPGGCCSPRTRPQTSLPPRLDLRHNTLEPHANETAAVRRSPASYPMGFR